MPHVEERVPGNAGRPGGRFGNLATTASSDELEFPLSKIKTKLNKDVPQVENDQTLSAPSSTSKSTKERNGGNRLARNSKTSTVDRK